MWQCSIYIHVTKGAGATRLGTLLKPAFVEQRLGVGVGQMLRTVQLDCHSRIHTEQIHFHVPPSVKGSWQLNVQAKPSGGFGQHLQSIAAARPFQGDRQVHWATCFNERPRILTSVCLVEIGCQEEAGFVLEHGIDSHDEIATVVILAGKMPADRLIRDRKEAAARAFGALDPGFLA